MKKIYSFLLISLSIITIQSCYYEDLNIDPTRPFDIDLHFMLPEAIAQSAYNQSADPARNCGAVVQQFGTIFACSPTALGENMMNEFWQHGLYGGVLKSCQTIIDKAKNEGNTYYEGIAKVLMAHNYGTATSYFGDIPMSQALQGAENVHPAYDSQEEVYKAVQEMLDEAISLLEIESDQKLPTNDDLLFGGDIPAWIAYAKGLKARFAVHTSNRGADWNQIAIWANEALASEGAFTYGLSVTENNPLAKFGQERPGALYINSRFANWMTDNEDPRQVVYMENRNFEWYPYNGANPTLKWSAADASIPVLSNVEMKFILAEAAYHTGGDVQTALNDAIAASMSLNGVDGTTYITLRGDISELSGEAVLERIIEEAYVAYYGIAFSETWMNFRRTGYPALIPIGGCSGLNPSGAIPRRFMYPASERQTNRESLEAAIENQGGALLDNTLWAF